MEKRFDLLGTDNEWYTVGYEYLNGVQNIENIKSLREIMGDKLEVKYNNGETLYYKNCFGTWGFPTKIR